MTGRRAPGPSRGRGYAGVGAPETSRADDLPKGEPFPNQACSGAFLAELLGVEERTLRNLADEGKVLKVGRGRYDLFGSLRLYVPHLRAVASGRGGDQAVATLTTERARLAREQADAWAKKNAVADRDLIPAGHVERRWREILAMLRARLGAIPSRVRQRAPHLTTTDVAALDREIRDALDEAADATPA